jgi:hypothetical protein
MLQDSRSKFARALFFPGVAFPRSAFRIPHSEFPHGVANGTRTRNNQNHNLELYH